MAIRAKQRLCQTASVPNSISADTDVLSIFQISVFQLTFSILVLDSIIDEFNKKLFVYIKAVVIK